MVAADRPRSRNRLTKPTAVADITLIAIALGAVAANVLNIYSGAISFTTLGIPIHAKYRRAIIAVVFGLSTDYEGFLVSRMVEARERGMSTAEAIRIGTATTGRIITAAATVLAVVAGSFVFSDLVMMKYLAFGLMAALLLDATVVRMFLVPSVMKLLGDDCWWAPRWMKRLQIRLGLGEIHLPDERKRPTARARGARPPVAARSPAAVKPHPPHDPTHPVVGAPARSRAASRPQPTPPTQDTPSRASTNRMPAAGGSEPEPTTTRFAARQTTATNAPPTDQREPHTPPNREIESWLSDLRGGSTPGNGPADVRRPSAAPPQPSTEQTRPVPTHRSGRDRPDDAGESTTAMPVPPRDNDAAMASEKLNTPSDDGNSSEVPGQRRSGGLSAQDLLRREGRI